MSDLEAEGHEVVATASDGAKALALCIEHQPDVLVVDFRMPPGSNGIETIAALREAAPAVAAVLYTNYRAGDLRGRAQALGATYLLKGNIRALRKAVREARVPA